MTNSIIIFLAGYLLRHIIGMIFNRLRKKNQSPLKGAEKLIDATKDLKVIFSFDNGKEWYVRDESGWAKTDHTHIINRINESENGK